MWESKGYRPKRNALLGTGGGHLVRSMERSEAATSVYTVSNTCYQMLREREREIEGERERACVCVCA